MLPPGKRNFMLRCREGDVQHFQIFGIERDGKASEILPHMIHCRSLGYSHNSGITDYPCQCDLRRSCCNPQNEMFDRGKTKCKSLKNETYLTRPL